MNRHLNEGQLRAALDDELHSGILLTHLERCPDCQARREHLRAQLAPVTHRLAFLAGQAEPASGLSAGAALQKFHTQKMIHKEIPMFKRLFASSLFRLSVAVLLIALVISIPATRALADRLLSLFRVQQVTVVPVDFTGMQQLTGNSAIGRQVGTLISDSLVVTQKPGDPQPATDAADASGKAGFAVRLPDVEKASSLNVMGATGFNFTINRAKAQSLLDEAGRNDLVLPATIDGAVIQAHIPASVSAGYGACPAPSVDGNGAKGEGSMGRQFPGCLILSELPSPLVTAPPGVDVAMLAQIGFEFSGMTTEQAAAFTKTVDWTSTLVIPIPRNAATYEQVNVDGVTGTLIKRPADDAPQFVLLWVRDGIVYAISGLGADTQKALALANSLK